MPRFRVHMINSDFSSSEEGDYASVEAAVEAGVRGAAEVASDQIAKGTPAAAIEIRVEQGDEVLARRVIAFSVSDLRTSE
jgi:hypothetical protein